MKRAAPAETGDIDVFALPVHPWAAMFPMHSDEELVDLAEDIKANGLRYPIVLGIAVTAEGFPAQLAVIDGRNRREACKRAGVKPETIVINGEDQDAYIASVNLKRRSLTKGQKAMLIAVRFPVAVDKGGRGKKKTPDETSEVSDKRISLARAVVKFCPEMVEQIIAGSMGLDEAYQEASRRKAVSTSHEARFAELQLRAPDLADLVKDDRLSIANAEAELRDRKARAENDLNSAVSQVKNFDRSVGGFDGVHTAKLAQLYRENRDRFDGDELPSIVTRWIEVLNEFHKELTQ